MGGWGGGFTDEVRDRATALGRRLVTAWKAGEVPEDVAERRTAFRRRMHALMDWRREEWPFEYNYWKENRGL